MTAALEDRVALPDLIVALTPAPPQRPRLSSPNYPELIRRKIARRVSVNDNGCWEWQGSLNPKGYGRMGAFGTKSVGAHIVSYAVFVDESPAPAGWSIDHLCSNRRCVNPDHLERVPHAENVRRGNTGITWSSRTHCSHGHEFTAENTGQRSDGTGRLCKKCRRESDRRRRAK